MRKLFLVAILFTIISVFSISFAQNNEEVDKELHLKCLYPTVMVFDTSASVGGTGFIVRSEKYGEKYRNAIITAQHITEGTGPFYCRYVKYKDWSRVEKITQFPLVVFAENAANDLAVAFFESDEQLPIVKINLDCKTYIGTKVLHCGFGMMDDARIDYGQITQPQTFSPTAYQNTIRTNIYSIMGDSGGPLFNKNLEVIGVCRAIRKNAEQVLPNQSYFTDLKELKTWDKSIDYALESVYNHKIKMPVLPFVKLEMQKYKFLIEE